MDEANSLIVPLSHIYMPLNKDNFVTEITYWAPAGWWLTQTYSASKRLAITCFYMYVDKANTTFDILRNTGGTECQIYRARVTCPLGIKWK